MHKVLDLRMMTTFKSEARSSSGEHLFMQQSAGQYGPTSIYSGHHCPHSSVPPIVTSPNKTCCHLSACGKTAPEPVSLYTTYCRDFVCV